MMPDGTFVQKMVEAIREPVVVSHGGVERLVAPQGWVEHPRLPMPEPKSLTVGTLTGLVDWVKRNLDGIDLAAVVVHVQDPSHVVLRAKLEGEGALFRRQTYFVASTDMVGPPALQFGQYVDAEQFVIGLQVGFVPTIERDDLVVLLASIRDNSVQETVDNGVAQEVKTARGVALVNRTRIPSPVELRPYRTFREVEQPASKFILRLKSGQEGGKPTCALFEAEGNAWKLAAIATVRAWIQDALGDTVFVIA